MGVVGRIDDRIGLLSKKREKMVREHEKELAQLDNELALLSQAKGAVTPQIERLIDQLNVVLTS